MLLTYAVILAVALALVGMLVVGARADYLDGKRALEAGDYRAAIAHLESAEVAGIPYGDARSLLDQATTFAQDYEAEYTLALQVGSAATAESRRLRRAVELFTSGHAVQAEALISRWSVRFPVNVLSSRLATGNGAVAALLLLAGARNALTVGDWQVAANEAQGVLVRYPDCAPATALAALADRRVRAETFVLRASALAKAGRWQPALAAVKTGLAIDPSYPRAAALRAHIETVLHRRSAARARARAAAARRRAAAAAAAAAPAAPAPAPVTNPRPVASPTAPPP